MKEEPWVSVEGTLFDLVAGQLTIPEAMAQIRKYLGEPPIEHKPYLKCDNNPCICRTLIKEALREAMIEHEKLLAPPFIRPPMGWESDSIDGCCLNEGKIGPFCNHSCHNGQ